MVCFDIHGYFIGLFVILGGYGGYDYILSYSMADAEQNFRWSDTIRDKPR
jgi:hypothetical protein